MGLLQVAPASAWSMWSWDCFGIWNLHNFAKCWGFRRRIQSDDPAMSFETALENALATGEILSVSPELWEMTLEHLADEGVSSRPSLEKTIFEETRESTTNGLLEDVLLVASIWERLAEHVDSNNDGLLSVLEWDAAAVDDWKSVPLPTTPEIFKAMITQSGAAKKIFADFFAASAYVGEAVGGLEAPPSEGSPSEGLEAPEGSLIGSLPAPLP